jgi:hypothetical protein
MTDLVERAIGTAYSRRLTDTWHLTDIDFVRALGGIAMHNPLGVAVWRARSGDFRDLRHMAKLIASRIIDGELVHDHNEARTAINRAANHLLFSACEWCRGAGQVFSGPRAQVCPLCDGMGEEPFDSDDDAEIWVLLEMRKCEAAATAELRRRLAGML